MSSGHAIRSTLALAAGRARREQGFPSEALRYFSTSFAALIPSGVA